jgi:hypothetical protein
VLLRAITIALPTTMTILDDFYAIKFAWDSTYNQRPYMLEGGENRVPNKDNCMGPTFACFHVREYSSPTFRIQKHTTEDVFSCSVCV